MKQIFLILSLVILTKFSFGQQVTVSDTLKWQLTGPANQKQLHQMVKKRMRWLMKSGWTVISAERINATDTYVWKMQKVITTKRRKTK